MNPEPTLAGFPEIVEIELTRRCNLACRMCQRSVISEIAGEGELTSGLLATILHQCEDHSPQINLGGLGESLLHKGLPQLLAMIKAHNAAIRTGFNTNGLLLTETMSDWLLDGRVDYLSISLNAPDAAGYRWLVGADAYDKAVRRARTFLRRKKRGRKPLTTVHTFRIPAFADRNRGFVERWGDLADFVQQRELGNWAGTVDRTVFGADPLVAGSCDRPWLSVAVDLDGGYHRCCSTFAIEKPRHTVRELTVGEYWRGTQMNGWRSQMTSGAFDRASPCTGCSGRAIPANSMIERAALKRQGDVPVRRRRRPEGRSRKADEDEDQGLFR